MNDERDGCNCCGHTVRCSHYDGQVLALVRTAADSWFVEISHEQARVECELAKGYRTGTAGTTHVWDTEEEATADFYERERELLAVPNA